MLKILRFVKNKGVRVTLWGVLFFGFLHIITFSKKYLDIYHLRFGVYRISPYTVVRSLAVVFALIWLAKTINHQLTHFINSVTKIEKNAKVLFSKFSGILVDFIMFIVALKMIGVNLSSFSLLGGTIGVGIGFGLQKVASNFISGIIILLEDSVKIGDVISLDDSSRAVVKKIEARYVLVDKYGGKSGIIPNEYFVANKFTNFSHSDPLVRESVDLIIPYGVDMDSVINNLIDIAKSNDLSSKEHLPFCRVYKLSSHGVNVTLYYWVDDISAVDPTLIKDDIIRKILKKFQELQIDLKLTSLVVGE